MAIFIKEIGRMICEKDKENINLLMEICIKENGVEINLMVTVNIIGSIIIFIKEIG